MWMLDSQIPLKALPSGVLFNISLNQTLHQASRKRL
jgi:hypothetical protein